MVRNGINPGDSTPLVLAGWNPPLSWKAENFLTQGCQTVDDRRRVRSLVYQNEGVSAMTIDAKFEKRGASSQGVALRPLRVLEELMHFHIRCAPLGLRLEVMRLAQPAFFQM